LVHALKLLNSQSSSQYQLHLVGGVSERDASYLKKVKMAAEGANVVIHDNASLETLSHLLNSCGIFWHATGLNTDQSSPEKLEHFGMSLVEAMSAGLVPFVFDSAGPHEILEEYPNNKFATLSELVSKTLEFGAISTESKSKISSQMQSRAQRFNVSQFAERVEFLIKKL
jgi:glycosyltransferase involved in cell wall biosynthesis